VESDKNVYNAQFEMGEGLKRGWGE